MVGFDVPRRVLGRRCERVVVLLRNYEEALGPYSCSCAPAALVQTLPMATDTRPYPQVLRIELVRKPTCDDAHVGISDECAAIPSSLLRARDQEL